MTKYIDTVPCYIVINNKMLKLVKQLHILHRYS